MIVRHIGPDYDGSANGLRILTNNEFFDERPLTDVLGYDFEDDYADNYGGKPAGWFAEIPNTDPLYYGTFDECCEYMRENYTRAEAKELELQLVLMSLDSNLGRDYCYENIQGKEALDEVYGEALDEGLGDDDEMEM